MINTAQERQGGGKSCGRTLGLVMESISFQSCLHRWMMNEGTSWKFTSLFFSLFFFIELNLLSVNGNSLHTWLLQCILHKFDIRMNTIIQAYEFKLRQTLNLKRSIAKRVITTSVNLRHLRSKLLKYKEIKKTIRKLEVICHADKLKWYASDISHILNR